MRLVCCRDVFPPMLPERGLAGGIGGVRTEVSRIEGRADRLAMTDMANTLDRGSSNATPLGHHSIFPVPCGINESGHGCSHRRRGLRV